MKTRNLFVKIVTVVLFSLLIVIFAIWGIGDVFRNIGRDQVIAKIGSTEIDQQQYSRELNTEISNLSRRIGTQLTMDQAKAFGIPQQVLSRMISRALLDELAKNMGMLITDDQLKRAVMDNPSFKGTNGRFDRDRFNQILRYSGLSEQGYLQQIGDDTLRQQLIDTVTKAAVAPNSLTDQLFAYREERRVADYVIVSDDSFTDIGTPDQAALQKTYDDAKNSFMTPAYKAITVAVLSTSAAAKKIAISDDRLAKAFEQRKAELSTPEKRTVEQVVLPDEKAAQALAARLSEGADFAAAVKQATGNPPIDLGAVTKGDLPPALGDAVFALSVGKPSAPVHTSLGWHVALVTAIQPGHEATLAESRDKLRKELAHADAVDVVIGEANKFDDALASGSSLEQAAQRVGAEVRKIPAIDKQGRTPEDKVVKDLPALDKFLGVLNGTKAGDTSVLTETPDGDYFIIRVDSETPPQKKPLDEVRDGVVKMWQDQQRAQMAEKKAKDVAERLKSGEDFAAVAKAEGLTVKQTSPVTRLESDPNRTPSPSLSQKLFTIKKDEVTTVSTGQGQIVAKLKEILPPASEGKETRLAKLEKDVTNSMQNDIFQEFLASLQKQYDVTVNQHLVDQTLSSY